MRISDWSSDVCSSDLAAAPGLRARLTSLAGTQRMPMEIWWALLQEVADVHPRVATGIEIGRSEEHTSELQSLMRISYAVFCLKKKIKTKNKPNNKLMTRLRHDDNN